ncbi:MAG: RNA-binding protein [Candidatus Omnitrophota bacterium]
MQSGKLYVGNLTYSVTKEQLQQLFSSHGSVQNITIIDGKGFGFVEMSTPAEAEAAKTALDGTEFEGRTLKIDEARPPKSRDSRDSRDRGGFDRGGNRGGGRGFRDRY